jgi:hypothetical protein
VEIEKLVKSITWRRNGKKQESEKEENSEVEDTVPVTSEFKDEVKRLVMNFKNHAKHVVGSSLNQGFYKHLSSLAKDESIVVAKYDKGNGVCVMDKDDYLAKLDDIVHDQSKFERLQTSKRKNARHPIFRRQEKVKECIKKHIEKFVPVEVTKKLKPSGCTTGKLYGTCKVHKDNYPVRPIVSMVSTPEYELAKYLDKLIKPNMPKCHSIYSNSDLLNKLMNFDHQKGDYCVSFDVVSLFTNIPLEDTITTIANVLYSDDAVMRPPMPKVSFIALLRCATGGIFSHRDQLYTQRDGVSMGNPLAPTLANFFLGYLETELLQETNIHYPAMYGRYVDDVFCVFRKDVEYKIFMKKLNNLHPNIKFTCEVGGNTMPFLDVQIQLGNGAFKSKVYRKKTDTNVLMQYGSNAPNMWKSGLIKCFLKRAVTVCSDDESLASEIKNLRNNFQNNGYLGSYFDRIKQEFFENKEPEPAGKDETKPTACLKVPYIGKASTLLGRRIKILVKKELKEDIRIVYQTNKVKDHFKLKDKTPHPIKPQVVYQFSCRKDPEAVYIGYTSRLLGERVKEHMSTTTAISEHVDKCDDCKKRIITTNDFRVLKQCKTKWETMIWEAILIKRYSPKLNKQFIKSGLSHTLKIFS